MPQYVGNLFQSCAAVEHPGSGAVTQQVWSVQPVGESTPGGRLPNDRPDDGSVNGKMKWCAVPDKYGAATPSFGQMPAEMQAVVTEFRAHPAGQFVQRVYRNWRLPSP